MFTHSFPDWHELLSGQVRLTPRILLMKHPPPNARYFENYAPLIGMSHLPTFIY